MSGKLYLNMKKIFVVRSWGGEYEDSWEHMECAFATKKQANEFIKQKKSEKKISDNVYDEIMGLVNDEEGKIYEKYYNFFPNAQGGTDHILKDGCTEDMYDDEYQHFYDVERYKLIKEKFGFTKEEMDVAEYDRTWNFGGYDIKEIDFVE